MNNTLLVLFRYNPTTGVFTVFPGGAGYYFFTNHFTVSGGELAFIDLRVNGEEVCLIRDDNLDSPGDTSSAGCSAVVLLAEGKSDLRVNFAVFTWIKL